MARNGRASINIMTARTARQYSAAVHFKLWFLMAAVALCGTSRAQTSGDLGAQDFFDALARTDSQEILQFVQNPDNLMVVDPQGNTPLHLAVRRSSSFAAELLLAYGADIAAENNQQQAPLEMLADERSGGDYASRREVVDAFIRHHLLAAPTSSQHRDDLRFRVAVRARDAQLAREAVADGADPNVVIDSLGNSLLHNGMWATMIPLVIELGGDVNRSNKLGDTPLRSALKRGDVRMAAALLDAGAVLSDNAELPELLLVIGSRSANTDALVDLLLDAGAPVRHDEWLAAMGSRDKDVVRRLWRRSPFDPESAEGEELIAEAMRRGGDEVIRVLRSDPELASVMRQRDASIQQSRDSDLLRYWAWLAPHLLVIVILMIMFAALSCLPAGLLAGRSKTYRLFVGISTALMTHLFLFTPVIDAALTEFRFFGERVPSLRYFAFAVFDGAALSAGWAIAALIREPATELMRRAAMKAAAVSLYVAAVSVLVAHNTGEISWPTTAYQHVTGFADKVAKEEELQAEQRAERAAMLQNENERKASAPHAPLFSAVEQADPAAATAALRSGLPVDTRNERGETALFVAAADGRRADVIPVLLAAGADPNALHDRGRRPVHALSSNGIGPRDPESMKLLVEAGADINARTDAGQTPLCSAHRRKQTAASQAYFLWLLEHGAEIKYSDTCATDMFVKNAKFFLPLLKKTADDIDQRRPFTKLNDQFGLYEVTPLWRAAYEKKVDTVAMLLALGANIESRDTKRGMTPLQIVVENSRYNQEKGKPLIELLLAEGADADAIAWDGSKLLDCEQQCRVQPTQTQ